MSVRVVARIRPLLDKDKELSKDIIVRAEGPEGKQNIVRIPNPKNESEEFSFTFNAVYDMPTSQEELFTNEVAPHLKSLFQGLDVTIFAYGVTGTGKTHTMRGGLKMTERGVIPRLLSGIYRRGRKVTKDSNGETSVSVTLSYYEIYNDKVFDLFETPDKRTLAGLPLRAAEDGKTVVVGLSERACDDLKDFERLYIEANNNRSTGATKLNAQSSRSHAILMVKVIQTNGEETLVSTASAIDLAGSEDNRRTDNGKERMVESASINKSLFVLSQCIDAIGRGDKRIPFRESKMTRILSLGQNNGITIMILNLAPLRSYHLDTLSSLNVSSRAKRIEVREIENEVVFKQPPRASASISGSNMQRQPLRPRDANVHAHVSAAVQKGDKPLKAFSVYSDKGKSTTTRSGTVPQRTNSTKRRSESGVNPRPTKMVRPNPTGVRPAAVAGLSAAKIEEMVEKKVSEILASRTQAQPPPVVSDISEAVQRRLDALERKVEESGAAQDERTEGLRFLLMAKQHKERGEDASALKMFEMALPFFPGQQKLLRKIDAMKARIKAKKDEAAAKESASDDVFGHSGEVPVARKPTAPFLQLPTPQTSFEMYQQEQAQQSKSRKPKISADSDDEYNGSALQADPLYEDDDSFSYKTTKSRKPKSSKSATRKSNIRVYADTETAGPLTPRTKSLLDIVNSRDVAMIKGLVGVGAKKARDLVEFLELQNEDEGGRIETLDQLMAVPGVGKGTVIRAYEGITA